MINKENLFTTIMFTLVIAITLAIFSWFLMNNFFHQTIPPGAKKVFKMNKLNQAGKTIDCKETNKKIINYYNGG